MRFHEKLVGLGHGLRVVVHRASADAREFDLARERQGVAAIDHRFALVKPALPSAPAKKSFSNAS